MKLNQNIDGRKIIVIKTEFNAIIVKNVELTNQLAEQFFYKL